MTAARLAALLAAAAAAASPPPPRELPSVDVGDVGAAELERVRGGLFTFTGCRAHAQASAPTPLSPRSALSHAMSASSSHESSLHALSACARSIFENCEMDHLHADRRFPRRLAAVEHAYMLVYSRDVHRLTFQRIQMPMLGVDASLVTGYDLEELTSAHRTCVFGAAAAARPATKYSSQLVKLWSVFFDIVRRRRHWSLVFEDDAIAQLDRLWAVDAALRLLHGAGHNATVSPPPAVVHLSSYHPIGHDMVPCGLQPRHRANKQYMAGVANAVTLIGARELLRVPIEATGSDAAFSDFSLNSTSQLAAFYMKPYAFTAGSYAEALVAEGVDAPEDLSMLEDADWPSAIKPLHLKKIKAAVAAAEAEADEEDGDDEDEDEEKEEDDEALLRFAASAGSGATARARPEGLIDRLES